MRTTALLALTLLLPALAAAEPARKVDALKGDLSNPDNFEQFVDQSRLRHGGPADAPVAAAPPQAARPSGLQPLPILPSPRLRPDGAPVPAWTPAKDLGRPAPTPPLADALALTGVALLGIAAFRSFGRAVSDKPQTDFVPAQEPPPFVANPGLKAPDEAGAFVDLEPLPDPPSDQA